ncbi:MAG: zf-TFIIB domain-containing protein [Bryobacteraceae bacterium]
MNCPNCGAPLRLEDGKDFLTCDYCKNVVVPDRNDDGIRPLGVPSDLSCPVCAVLMVVADVAGERVQYCEHCKGLLISMDALLGVTDELRARHGEHSAIGPRPDPKELERRIDCPKCHQQMDTHFYEGSGNIVIDDCERCCLDWLDQGELMRIARAPGA